MKQNTKWRCFIVLAPLILIRACLVPEDLIPGINPVNPFKIYSDTSYGASNDIKILPVKKFPNQALMINYQDLLDHHLLNALLVPTEEPWSGSYFSLWLGGISGRWQENFITL